MDWSFTVNLVLFGKYECYTAWQILQDCDSKPKNNNVG